MLDSHQPYQMTIRCADFTAADMAESASEAVSDGLPAFRALRTFARGLRIRCNRRGSRDS